jgi:hypothetical protein
MPIVFTASVQILDFTPRYPFPSRFLERCREVAMLFREPRNGALVLTKDGDVARLGCLQEHRTVDAGIDGRDNRYDYCENDESHSSESFHGIHPECLDLDRTREADNARPA